MLKKNLAFFLLPVFIFSFGCEGILRDEFYKLSLNYRTYLRTGDTIIFVNNKFEQDSFRVFKKINATYRISLSGSTCKSDPSAYFDAEFLLINRFNDQKNTSFCSSLNNDKMYGDCEADFNCKESISIAMFATDTERNLRSSLRPQLYWYGDVYKLDSIISKMKVLEYSYDSVFHFSSTKTYKNDFKEIIYSSKYGIIQMIEFNGNELNLLRK